MEKDYNDEFQKKVEKPVGKRDKLVNRRGKEFIPRCFHMTKKKLSTKKQKWVEDAKEVNPEILKLVGSKFFNPFRAGGPFYGALQALFLLGANKYYTYFKIHDVMEEVMDKIMVYNPKDKETKSAWIRFLNRSEREDAINTKDIQGRIHGNFRTMQRLGGVNPYGYKLKQICCCVDIRKVYNKDLGSEWAYCLNTKFKSSQDVKPTYNSKIILLQPELVRSEKIEKEKLEKV